MMPVCCQCQVVPIFTCKHGYVISHLKHFEYEAVTSNEAFKVHGDAWSALYSLSYCSKVLRTCGGFLCYSLIGLIIFVLPFNPIVGKPNPIMTWSLHFHEL